MLIASIAKLGKSVKSKNQDLMSLAFGGEEEEDDDEDEEEEDEDESGYKLTEEEIEERRQALAAQESMYNTSASSLLNKKYKKPVSIPTAPPDDLIGRSGFKKMLLNGDIFVKNGYDDQSMESYFNNIDHVNSGAINFYDFWTWFLSELQAFNKNNPKRAYLVQKNNQPFTMYDIISLRDRAMLRFADRPT